VQVHRPQPETPTSAVASHSTSDYIINQTADAELVQSFLRYQKVSRTVSRNPAPFGLESQVY